MTTPPQDRNGELDKANRLLKRFRRQLEEQLPPDWRAWLADSLAATYRETEKPSGAKS